MALYKETKREADEGGNTYHTSLNILFETGEMAGEQHIIEDNHPKFDVIKQALEAESDGSLSTEEAEVKIVKVIDPYSALADERITLSDKVSYDGEEVYYRDEPVDTDLAQTIMDASKEGNHKYIRSLVAFLEKVYSESTDTARKNLFRWINDRGIAIHSDGSFIAYKGVEHDGEGGYRSINSGSAFVNGKPHKGKIPNAVGDVVTMPPSAVEDDENVACAPGLHAGTYSYASGWARGAVLTVKIDPSDVISVPRDSNGQKIRTSRYTVLDITEKEYEAPVWGYDEEDEFDDDWDDDPYDDDYYEDLDNDYDPDEWEEEYHEYKRSEEEDSKTNTYGVRNLQAGQRAKLTAARDGAENGWLVSFDYNGRERVVKVDEMNYNYQMIGGYVVNEGDNVYKNFKFNGIQNVELIDPSNNDYVPENADSDEDNSDADEPVETAYQRAQRDPEFSKSYYAHPSNTKENANKENYSDERLNDPEFKKSWDNHPSNQKHDKDKPRVKPLNVNKGDSDGNDTDKGNAEGVDDSASNELKDDFSKFVKDADERITKWFSDFRETPVGKKTESTLDGIDKQAEKFEKNIDDFANKVGKKFNSFLNDFEKRQGWSDDDTDDKKDPNKDQ